MYYQAASADEAVAALQHGIEVAQRTLHDAEARFQASQEASLFGFTILRAVRNGAGRIVDFEVMVRPFNGLQALGAEMGARLAAFLPAYKG